LIELHEKQVNGDTVVCPAPQFTPSKLNNHVSYSFLVNLEATIEKVEVPKGINLLMSTLSQTGSGATGL